MLKIGGRKDLDVVGVDPKNGTILLIDVKGDWSGSVENICSGVVERLLQGENLLKKLYGEGWRFEKMLVLIDLTASRSKIDEIRSNLAKHEITVKTLSELIEEIAMYIDEWRKRVKELGLVSEETKPAIPENMYLLKLLEFIKDKGFLHKAQHRVFILVMMLHRYEVFINVFQELGG